MRARALLLLLVSSTANAQSLTRSQQAVCEEAANVQDRDPFSMRDNVVTGVAAAADMGASLLVHTFPAFMIVPIVAIALDTVIGGKSAYVALPQGFQVNAQLALVVLGTLLAAYAVVTPAADAAILLGVRAIFRGALPPWRHALAVVVASYLSFPVALAGALGLVGVAGALVTPNMPGVLGPAGSLLQGSLPLLLFAVTVEGVFVVVRPVALAMFERAGNAYFPRRIPETEHVIASPSTGGKT